MLGGGEQVNRKVLEQNKGDREGYSQRKHEDGHARVRLQCGGCLDDAGTGSAVGAERVGVAGKQNVAVGSAVELLDNVAVASAFTSVADDAVTSAVDATVESAVGCFAGDVNCGEGPEVHGKVGIEVIGAASNGKWYADKASSMHPTEVVEPVWSSNRLVLGS